MHHRHRRWNGTTGQGLSVWDTTDYHVPVAAPAEVVAERLGVTLEDVHRAGVEPYWRADGQPVISLHLTAVALGLRPSRVDRRRGRAKRSPEARARQRQREHARDRRQAS